MIDTQTQPRLPRQAVTRPEAGASATQAAPAWFNRVEAVLTVFCALFLVGGVTADALGTAPHVHNLLFLGSYLTGGVVGTVTALAALRERRLDVNGLMIIAAIGAASIDYWAEGATLLFLFSLSNTLQAYAMARSRNAIRALVKLRPNQALRRTPDGVEQLVPIQELERGDLIVVKPGERIAMDGRVVRGASAVD